MTLFARSLNLPMLWLTERVNLRHYIFCVPLKVPQRGKNRSGFPSNSRHFVLSAQNKMCERFYILSRKENRAFPRRTPVWQSFALRGKSECAALHAMRALKNAAQRENPAARRNADGGLSFTSRKNDLSAQIIFRKLKYFSARLKTALFNKRTQFAAYLRPQRVNAAHILWCALQKVRRRGQSPQTHDILFCRHKTKCVNGFIFFARGKPRFPAAHPCLAILCLAGKE